MKSFWDNRYSEASYAYGIEPNVFFAKHISQLKPAGNLLLPAEGQGRNAVYAAQLGWKVDAFDLSVEGRQKAMELAIQKGVTINYEIKDLNAISFPPNSYDAIGLIYVHMPPKLRVRVHEHLINALKVGGTLILEAFNPRQLSYQSGGPKTKDQLYTEEILKGDFHKIDIQDLSSLKTVLNEGKYHLGPAEVIRLVAQKRRH